jgi:hypothetical protein
VNTDIKMEEVKQIRSMYKAYMIDTVALIVIASSRKGRMSAEVVLKAKPLVDFNSFPFVPISTNDIQV